MKILIATAAALTALYLSKAGYGSFDERNVREVSVTNPSRCGLSCIILDGKPVKVEGTIIDENKTYTLSYKMDARSGTAWVRGLQ
jgi:hypothetical protein